MRRTERTPFDFGIIANYGSVHGPRELQRSQEYSHTKHCNTNYRVQ